MTKTRERRPTGRPREYVNRAKLTVMLEHDELLAITEAARVAGEPVNYWLRRAALAQLRRERKGKS